nr:type VII secretion target [Streptomyces sp. SID5468]
MGESVAASSEHFFIEPGRVTALADDFSSSGRQLGGKVQAFASGAENVDDAFGVMSQSTDALAAYVRMTQSTVTALRSLVHALDQYATGLRQTVTDYQAVDQANAQRLGGVPDRVDASGAASHPKELEPVQPRR